MAIAAEQTPGEIEAGRIAYRREAIRVWMVRIIFVLYWLLIFTGALRKWGDPHLQKPLFFIAVPFTVGLYAISLLKNRWPKNIALLDYSYILAWAALVLIPIQMILGNYALRYMIIAGYGWLNYFFYIPLVFIIAKEFRLEDVRRLLRHTLWIGILSAPVVALQFFSPADSVINAGNAVGATDQFHQLASALGHIRPAGFFSSSIGLWMFLSTLTVAVLYGWISSGGKVLTQRWILVVATLSLLMMMAFSGSRGAMIQSALVFVATAIAGLISNRRQLAVRAGLWPLSVILLLVVLWPLVLPHAYDTFMTRWNQAEAESPFALGIFGRALYPFYAWVYYLTGPFSGYLLGIATNAAARVSWVQMPAVAYTWGHYGIWARESGWAAQLVELGWILGLGYIFFRVWFAIWLLVKVWHSTRKNHDPLAFMLFSFSGELILMGQVTIQGTVNGYTWMFLGVTLAAVKFALAKGDDADMSVR